MKFCLKYFMNPFNLIVESIIFDSTCGRDITKILMYELALALKKEIKNGLNDSIKIPSTYNIVHICILWLQ